MSHRPTSTSTPTAATAPATTPSTAPVQTIRISVRRRRAERRMAVHRSGALLRQRRPYLDQHQCCESPADRAELPAAAVLRPFPAAKRGCCRRPPTPSGCRSPHLEHAGDNREAFTFPRVPQSGQVAELTFADSAHGWAITRPTSSGSANTTYLYATADGGRRWSVIAHDPPTNIAFSSATEGWAAGRLNHLEHTTDGGHTWQAVRVPTPPYDRSIGVYVTPTVTSNALIVNGWQPTDMTSRFFDISIDGGRTWRAIVLDPRTRPSGGRR